MGVGVEGQAAPAPGRRSSRPQPLQHPRKRNRLPHVGQAADPGDDALEAHAEAGVGYRAVAAEIEIPAERLLGEVVGADLPLQRGEIVLALAAVDDLAGACGCEYVDAERQVEVG